MQDTNVCLEVEISSVLYDGMQKLLELSPELDQERLFRAALSLYLLQNCPAGVNVAAISSEYIAATVAPLPASCRVGGLGRAAKPM